MSVAHDGPKSQTYPASCHCGAIRFAVTLSPPLKEQRVLECNCSICRRNGYLLVYPKQEHVVWHGDSKEKCGVYKFNSKKKDHLFCKECGSSLGIYFQEDLDYGINVRALDGVNLVELQYRKGNGLMIESPAGDLSGVAHQA